MTAMRKNDAAAEKYLRLLSEKFPTKESVSERLIHLSAQLGLPKGVEHFMSDLHGEYGTFFHIFNNCSGVIREKVEYVFGDKLTKEEQAEFCTLIYYPREKIEQIAARGTDMDDWMNTMLARLVALSKLMSYKYPLAKVRSFVPRAFASVVIELLATRPGDDPAQRAYHERLITSIIEAKSGASFIETFTAITFTCLAISSTAAHVPTRYSTR